MKINQNNGINYKQGQSVMWQLSITAVIKVSLFAIIKKIIVINNPTLF